MAQHPQVFPALHVPVVFQNHLIPGQRAGFVGAQHVHGPEILNGVEIFYNDLPPSHDHRAFGQTGGDNHGQHLRRQTHGHGDGEQERRQPVALGQPRQHKDQGHHDQHKADQDLGYGVDAASKTALRGLLGQAGGNGAELRFAAYCQYHGGRRAGHDTAALQGQIFAFRGAFVGGKRGRRLFDGGALTGETGLADEAVPGLQNADVGGNQIAHGQVNDIAHHQLFQGQLLPLCAVAGDGAGGGNHGQELFRGVGAAALLDKPQNAGNGHHAQNDDDRNGVEFLRRAAEQREPGKNHVGDSGHQGQAKQNRRKGIDKGAPQLMKQGGAAAALHGVGAVLGTAFRDCLRREAGKGGVQVLQHRTGGVGGCELQPHGLLAGTDSRCVHNSLHWSFPPFRKIGGRNERRGPWAPKGRVVASAAYCDCYFCRCPWFAPPSEIEKFMVYVGG